MKLTHSDKGRDKWTKEEKRNAKAKYKKAINPLSY